MLDTVGPVTVPVNLSNYRSQWSSPLRTFCYSHNCMNSYELPLKKEREV